MKEHTVAVDVDLTVIHTDKLWKQWLDYFNGFADKIEIPETNIEYDLSKYYPNLARNKAMAFWNDENLYQLTIDPIQDSVSVLKDLSERYNIVFVSACKGPHYRSKYHWLKHHFPFMDAFISTKEKHFIDASWVIDDRVEYIKHFNPNKTKRMLYQTPYKQSESMCNVINPYVTIYNYDNVVTDWSHIGQIFNHVHQFEFYSRRTFGK